MPYVLAQLVFYQSESFISVYISSLKVSETKSEMVLFSWHKFNFVVYFTMYQVYTLDFKNVIVTSQ